jgi:hypothetical protein
MTNAADLEEALESKSLTALTKAISIIADRLGYQLKPPHTDVGKITATEEADECHVHFEARLYLHYSAHSDGLVFTIEFGGDAVTETPTPLLYELFYAAVVKEMRVYGYGSKWSGKSIATPQEFRMNLELTSPTINEMELREFLSTLQRMLKQSY